MTFDDRGNTDQDTDESFERRLLESARARVDDGSPNVDGVDRAWRRFSAALTTITTPRAAHEATRAAQSGGSHAVVKVAATRWRTARWVAFGAVTGSLLTLLTIYGLRERAPMIGASADAGARTRGAPERVERSPATLRAPGPDATRPPAESSVAAPIRTESQRPSQDHPPELCAAKAPRRVLAESPARVPAVSSRAPRSESDLRAQVTLLDAARAAAARGGYDAALRLVEQFHRKFPAGELSPDAEVVAIEVLAAEGARAAFEERAARFLERHPDDPHAGRVAALMP
jgi:hypothetical protein